LKAFIGGSSDRLLRRKGHLWPLLLLELALAGGVVLHARDTPNGHWAFQPVQRVVPPTVPHPEFVESPIDAFILQKLDAVGLTPASEADRRTLLRRASYNLTGLPPTPAELAEFFTDPSPDAFARVTDRLLASPHYGERWGRHWLDVARYADTRGDTVGGDPLFHFAYTFRDYVVRALNEDLPYDRFLIEQIAADQLDLGEHSSALAALGFITVGRRFLNNVHDTIDDRIDVVTRTTMALTVSCARCHDHMYDPIPTADYYSLYGVFSSTHEPDPLPVIGKPDPAALADYQRQREQLDAKRVEYIRQKESEIVERYRGLTAQFLLESRRSASPERESQSNTAFGETSVFRVGARRWRKALGKIDAEHDPVFAPWFAFAALPEAEFAERAPALAANVAGNRLAHPVNPLVADAFAGAAPSSLNAVADRYAQLLELATSRSAAAADAWAPENGGWHELRRALVGDGAPGHLSEETIRRLFPPMAKMQIQQLGSELNRLDATHPGAPIRAMAVADNPQPQNARIFLRGNPNNPGNEVPRQFLQILAGNGRQPFTKGSGRLELALAIASGENPLTARVMANRVWLHHFGEGLVTTPDDFGLRCDPPSHPELFDFLAACLMEDGWSLKRLHRRLMASRIYRQASDDGLSSAAADPENRLLSKANLRRLDFEALRDTVLFVAGNLDCALGGRPVPLVSQPRVQPGGAFDGRRDDGELSRRRAIYGFIDRQNLPGLLRAFDVADPDTITGRRYATTVPQQALYFFNSPFVMQQALSLATASEFQEINEAAGRVRHLYQRIVQRDPTAEEIDLARRFLAKQAPVAESTVPDAKTPPFGPWERLAHVLLMSNELMFVD
jgi:hypothetical protein